MMLRYVLRVGCIIRSFGNPATLALFSIPDRECHEAETYSAQTTNVWILFHCRGRAHSATLSFLIISTLALYFPAPIVFILCLPLPPPAKRTAQNCRDCIKMRVDCLQLRIIMEIRCMLLPASSSRNGLFV